MTNFNDLLDTLDLEEFYMDDEDIVADANLWESLDSTEDDEDDAPGAAGIRLNVMWILDGADTLSEASRMARQYADFLDTLESDGYELEETLEDGTALATITNSL